MLASKKVYSSIAARERFSGVASVLDVLERYSGQISLALVILSIAALVTQFLSFRFSFPPLRQDEASFFEPAYNLVMSGKFSSDLHASFLPGADMYTYWMPPLYMLFLAAFMQVVGIGISQAKLFSVICIIAASGCLIVSLKEWRSRFWVAALLLVSPFILFASAAIRMEALGVLLTTIAILTLSRQPNRNVLLGAIAALCAVTHPILMACSAALGSVALQRGVKALSLFLLTLCVVLLPYLIYILRDPGLFLTQMSLQFGQKAGRGFSTLSLAYVIQTLPLALAALMLVFQLESRELRRFFGVGLVLTVIVILKSQEFNYHVYTIPYVLGALGLYIDQNRHGVRILLPFAVFALFVGLLIAKARHYRLHDDESFYDLVRFVDHRQNDWRGRKIYVEGEPDVAVLFRMRGQHVERMNGAASQTKSGWAERYDYVVCVDSIYPTTANYTCSTDGLPWAKWDKRAIYSSRGGIYTIRSYAR